MDIKREQIERKKLTEECWIKLSDFELKIDYPTRNQEAEYRRLNAIWLQGLAGESEHFLNFYIRATVKDIRGLTVNGKPLKLEVIDGLATNLIGDGEPLDLIATLFELGLWEASIVSIRAKLEMTQAEKKTSESQPNSLGTGSSESSQSSEGEKSSTPIIPLPQTAGTT